MAESKKTCKVIEVFFVGFMHSGKGDNEIMCGITGWISWEKDLANARQVLSNMVETMAARGPDGSGIYLSTHAALGHRRLSVVDPQNGAQPMTRSKGDYSCVITYNGELYNTPELRQELITWICFQNHLR